MKVFLNQAMDMHIENSQYNQGNPMHNDLIISHKSKVQEINTRIEKSFKETEYEKFKRHYDEYNNQLMPDQAELYIKKLIINQ